MLSSTALRARPRPVFTAQAPTSAAPDGPLTFDVIGSDRALAGYLMALGAGFGVDALTSYAAALVARQPFQALFLPFAGADAGLAGVVLLGAMGHRRPEDRPAVALVCWKEPAGEAPRTVLKSVPLDAGPLGGGRFRVALTRPQLWTISDGVAYGSIGLKVERETLAAPAIATWIAAALAARPAPEAPPVIASAPAEPPSAPYKPEPFKPWLTAKEFPPAPCSRRYVHLALDATAMRQLDASEGAAAPPGAKDSGGYGKKYREDFQLADAYVEVYHGVFDGWCRRYSFAPRPYEDALRLARTFDLQQKLGRAEDFRVDFLHPVERTAKEVRCTTTGDGCQEEYRFILDGEGRCTAIICAGAC
mgnify:CR=1 FL=1